ncbi:MAG: hypothetical protein WC992_01460 [Acholeplasmataceae bacterium]|jgi:hypothetical protein|nr:hypothetical protein [Acholeplasmataceae bacterium]
MDELIYFVSLIVFFAISLRILRAIHIENKFEKFKMWEIKTAYFLLALLSAHLLAEVMVKLSQLLTGYFN